MHSLDDLTRKEIQTLFNFDNNLEYSENLKLKKPNFKKKSLKSICNHPVSTNFTNYCKLVRNLPDLQTTMQLMSLAMSSTNFDSDNIVDRVR